MHGALRLWPLFASTLALLTLSAGSTAAADLSSPQPQAVPNAISSGWEFTFTPYLWRRGSRGNATIKGRTFDVQAHPSDFGALKFAVMGDLEARKGPFSLMVDGFYGNQ